MEIAFIPSKIAIKITSVKETYKTRNSIEC